MKLIRTITGDIVTGDTVTSALELLRAQADRASDPCGNGVSFAGEFAAAVA